MVDRESFKVQSRDRAYTFHDVTVAGGYGYVADVTEAGTLDIAF